MTVIKEKCYFCGLSSTTFLKMFALFLVIYLSEISALPTTGAILEDLVAQKEVGVGDTAKLICESNDKNHSFILWHWIDKGQSIGVGHEFSDKKYKYEILTGILYIRAVTKNDAGIYTCLSRAVTGNDINIRSVRMVVQQDWEQVYEHDSSVNVFRVLIVLITLVLVAGLSYAAYRVWRNRYRHPRYLEEEDEDDDSGEELFSRPEAANKPGPSRIAENIVKEKQFKDIHEDHSISTDFNSILDSVNK